MKAWQSEVRFALACGVSLLLAGLALYLVKALYMFFLIAAPAFAVAAIIDAVLRRFLPAREHPRGYVATVIVYHTVWTCALSFAVFATPSRATNPYAVVAVIAMVAAIIVRIDGALATRRRGLLLALAALLVVAPTALAWLIDQRWSGITSGLGAAGLGMAVIVLPLWLASVSDPADQVGVGATGDARRIAQARSRRGAARGIAAGATPSASSSNPPPGDSPC